MTGVFYDLKRLSPTAQCLLLALLCWPVPVLALFSDVGVGQWPLTLRGAPVMVDFANFWVGADAAWSGDFRKLFERDPHVAHGAEKFGSIIGTFVWSYPPPMLLVALPLAYVTSYAAACLLWLGVSLGLLCAALWFHGDSSVSRRSLALIAAATVFMPGTFQCLGFGQTALITSAVLCFGVLLAPTRPIFAGAILALLVCKPQVGIMVPAALIGLGAWRAFVATPVFAALYAGLALAVFGPEPWHLFVSTTLPQQLEFLTNDIITPALRISPYFLFLATGLSVHAAMALQMVVIAFVMVLVVVILRQERCPDLQFLAVALSTLLASPYLQMYELPLLALAVGRIAIRATVVQRLGPNAMLVLAFAASIGTLLTCAVLSRSGFNLTPVGIFGVLVWINRHHLKQAAGEVMTLVGARRMSA